jgi:hypothetical protein
MEGFPPEKCIAEGIQCMDDHPCIAHVSRAYKCLIQRMFDIDSNVRINAPDALEHSWIADMS